jgi:LEA14-like dessication related protein
MRMIRLIFAYLLVGLVVSSCGKIEEPEFRKLNNFGIRKLGLQESTIGFNAVYYNPNNFGVSVKEAVLDVYLDSTYIGKFIQPHSVDVANKAEFSIPLEATLTFQNAMTLGLEKKLGKEVLVRADGSVRIGKAGVYVTRDIDYRGRHLLDLDLIKNPAGAGLDR